MIRFVPDRPGHDRRYAIDASKIMNELGWSPEHKFEEALPKTIEWYIQNKEWVNRVQQGNTNINEHIKVDEGTKAPQPTNNLIAKQEQTKTLINVSEGVDNLKTRLTDLTA